MPAYSPVIRTAIAVADLDRSKAFYRDVLGYEEVFLEGALTEGNAHAVLGLAEGTHTRACIFKRSGPATAMIGLFELTNPLPPTVARKDECINLGEGCLVLYCDDLDAVTAHLDAGGHVIVSRPTPLEVGGYIKQREMVFRDPDGMLINLIEWDPARAAAGDPPELWPGNRK